MVMAVEAMGPQLDQTAREWAQGVDHGANWIIKIVGTKYTVVESAWKVVDTALDLAGGYGIFKTNEVERLCRDARLGRPAAARQPHRHAERQRVHDEHDEQQRRAPQDLEVLEEQPAHSVTALV